MLKIISSIYLLALIILSLVPLSGIESPGNSDKIAHFIAYAVLSVMAYFAAGSFKQRAYLLLSLIALGIILEALQLVIPGRNFDYFDMLANIAGAISGFCISWMIRASREQPRYGGCGSPHTTVPVKHVDEEKGL